MKDPRWSVESLNSGKLVDEPARSKQPICLQCRHLLGFTSDAKPYCKAFPNGIPDKFWNAKVDHTAPYTGDNGITFEP